MVAKSDVSVLIVIVSVLIVVVSGIVDCSIFNVDCSSGCFLRRFFFGMTGIDDGGSGMFVDIGQDVVLAIDDEDDDDGDTGEPPALLPLSQFVLDDDNNVDDGRRTRPGRFDDEPVDNVELVGDITFGRIEEEDNCF